MPNITAETPREDYTIAGQTFAIYQPYEAGHVLSEGEASQLNQVFAENIRNNRAKWVTELVEAGSFDQDSAQEALDEYMDSYEMGVRTGGGRIGDPVLSKAVDLARGKVREAILKAGRKITDYTAKDITDRAKQAVQDNPAFLVKAKEILALAEGLSDLNISAPDSGRNSQAA